MGHENSEVNFSGQKIYAGIDVHKKQWYVSVGLSKTVMRSFSQPPEAQILHNYLTKTYPGGTYECGYEAGYCGYWIKEELEELGVSCLVINASDIPTTDKERRQKTDKRDSLKILKGLQAEQLRSIHVPAKERQQARALLRDREAVVKATRRIKNQIKSKLLFFGVNLPSQFDGCRWSGRFLSWLEALVDQAPLQGTGLNFQLQQLQNLRQLNVEMVRQLRILSKSETYAESYSLLLSIPGIGLLSAMKYLLELGPTIDRFANLDRHASFIGLVPRMYNSGDKERTGSMTKSGNKLVKTALIESAWVARKYDPVLALKYEGLVSRMKPNKAIVIIAKKLLSRIRFVLKHRQPYQQLS